MQIFNPRQYLAIDIANQYGLDKESWDDRLQWVRDNHDVLETFEMEADERFLFIKAVKALRSVEKGNVSNFIMGLDATASGYQIMACLSNCSKTGRAVNLVNTGNREDLYTNVADTMNASHGTNVNRDKVKKPKQLWAANQ